MQGECRWGRENREKGIAYTGLNVLRNEGLHSLDDEGIIRRRRSIVTKLKSL